MPPALPDWLNLLRSYFSTQIHYSKDHFYLIAANPTITKFRKFAVSAKVKISFPHMKTCSTQI